MIKNIFSARRILPTDVNELCELAAKNKEFSFFNLETATSIMQSGEMWCCVNNRQIAAFGGFVPISSKNSLCEAVVKTRLLPQSATVVLPVCCKEEFKGADRFFEWYHSRAGGKNKAIASLLPVKSNAQKLGTYFSLGLCLAAMRPLHNLRPNYIFIERIMQFEDKEAIMVNAQDTLLLSRFLETGYCGVEAIEIENELKVKLVKLF